jgi:hypothetical protein
MEEVIEKKSVGLITMHRVLNFGSVLQAYALQRKVQELGYNCEIIDYVFPNNRHFGRKKILERLKQKVRFIISNVLLGFPAVIKRKRFQAFYDRFLSLSPQTYASYEDIHDNPPAYDIYLTGSDQVWNPRHVKDDTTFFLSFCKERNAARISFASSFSTNRIPEEFRNLYARHLSSFDRISVRESSGIGVVADLTRQKAEVVCDPTLLLNGKEWSELAEYSRIKIKQPYVLAYVLTYAFNPYPQIHKMIAQIQDQLKMPVVYLDGRLADYMEKNARVIKKAGPCEFIWLFKHAGFVVTHSLHGTAFALNFSKPFYSVIENTKKDSRILSLLQLVGADDCAKTITDNNIKVGAMDYAPIAQSLEKLRNRSASFLKEALRV